MKTIDVEIGLEGIELDPTDFGRWVGASHVTSYGNNFDELLINAEVHFTDQDGGEVTTMLLCDLGLHEQAKIEAAIIKSMKPKVVR